jgi:hypothetical protein
VRAAVNPLFADMFDHVGKVVLGALAVAGGFLIGNLLTLVACRILAKFVFKQKFNEKLEKALRVIGGIALAVLIAFLVFQGGSGWGFGGGGSGEGSGDDGKGEGKSGEVKVRESPTTPKTVGSATFEVTEFRIVVLPSKEYPRIFRFAGAQDVLDLAGAKARLKELQDGSKGNLRIELAIYKDSPAEDHPDIRALTDYAHNTLGISTLNKKMDRRYAE